MCGINKNDPTIMKWRILKFLSASSESVPTPGSFVVFAEGYGLHPTESGDKLSSTDL